MTRWKISGEKNFRKNYSPVRMGPRRKKTNFYFSPTNIQKTPRQISWKNLLSLVKHQFLLRQRNQPPKFKNSFPGKKLLPSSSISTLNYRSLGNIFYFSFVVNTNWCTNISEQKKWVNKVKKKCETICQQQKTKQKTKQLKLNFKN